MQQRLHAKDFILIGVLTALMWFICMLLSGVLSFAGPVTNVFYPSIVPVATKIGSEGVNLDKQVFNAS